MGHMEESWKKSMADNFNSFWINVIDKRMMDWYNKFETGLICVTWESHIFGNKRHTICCGIPYIFQRAHIVGGKDRPEQLGPNMNLEIGRIIGVMILMYESIFSTGKSVVMGSGFVLQIGLFHLRQR